MPTPKQMFPYLFASVIAAMSVYVLALLSGTDFSRVSAPPALISPIPWWLFAAYSIAGAAAMFPVFALSLKFPKPRLMSIAAIFLGLGLMTPAPFLVSSDIATLIWLTASHIALVAPLIALARALPSDQPSDQPSGSDNSKGSENNAN